MNDRSKAIQFWNNRDDGITTGTIVTVLGNSSGHKYVNGNSYVVIRVNNSDTDVGKVYRLRNKNGFNCQSILAVDVRKATPEELLAFLEASEQSALFNERVGEIVDDINFQSTSADELTQ